MNPLIIPTSSPLLTQTSISHATLGTHSSPSKSFSLPEWLVLGALVLLKLGLQYALVDSSYDLHRDEYLHLDQANHLAAGYLSVPPFTSWVAWIIKALGNGVFWVRFFPALFGALTMVTAWKIVQELQGGWYAKVLVAGALLFSTLLRLNMLFQPNSADILAWTLVFYLLIRYVRWHQPKDLLWLGVVVGFGVLNKYNIAFLVVGLLPALAFSEHRRIFTQPALYAAAVLALLIFLPNLWWQYSHGWPVIHHMQELEATQLVNVDRGAFWLDQVLFFFGSVYLLGAALLGMMLYPGLRPYRFVGVAFVVTMLLFTYLRAKSYYAIGIYPVLLCVGAVYWEHLFRQGWKRITRPFWIALNLLLFVPLVKVLFPVLSPTQIHANAAPFKKYNLLKWEDGHDHELPQDFADMLGWRELTQHVEKAFALVPVAERANTLIICDNYGQTGAVNFYKAKDVPAAYSFNADYIFWYPTALKVQNIVLVKEAGEAPLREKEKPFVQSVTLIDSLSTPFAREQGARTYLLKGVSSVVGQALVKRAHQKQQEWRQ
ncbi:glycosyl transferase [Nibribacter ruber]|uniref:Glycosyl transferase n=1 Tax=Nibribacter ruber TaxID=2698458 RepID=A0A6P1NYE4_9BACT|nr:glycosyltransferase family 39 protein [Nibribacter ruber]QHL86978.1 glycosyl transferase [Nibribacter ruber]